MQSLEACWTSGGGDLTAGSVERTVLIFSQEMRDLLQEGGGHQGAVVERVATLGDRLCQVLPVPLYDVPLYLGVFGVDSAGNKGAVSNIVRLLVTSPPVINIDNQVSHLITQHTAGLYVLQYKPINNQDSAQFVFLKLQRNK